MSALKTPYFTASSATAEENILRGLFTFFLNTGRVDELVGAQGIRPQSARTDHVGHAVWAAHGPSISKAFLDWAVQDELAEFLLSGPSGKCVMQAFKAATQGRSHGPVDAIVGARHKDLTSFERDRLPKDLRKSFYKKASTQLMKFVAEHQSNQGKIVVFNDETRADAGSKSVEGWLRAVLLPANKDRWVGSEPLRKIRSLYWKTMRHENVDSVVYELVKTAQVAGVMLA